MQYFSENVKLSFKSNRITVFNAYKDICILFKTTTNTIPDTTTNATLY